jgi:hypothetical protein
MERGEDPDIRKYFRKILHSFSYGLLWLAGNIIAGIYYGLAYKGNRPLIFTIFFYAGLFISLALLLRYYYRTWKK